MKAIDLLKNANQNKIKSIEFVIPIDDNNGIDTVLQAPDLWSLKEEQEKVYHAKLVELCQEGYDQYPINEQDFNKEVENYLENLKKSGSKDIDKAVENYKKDRPKSLADQLAQRTSKYRTIFEILPKFLRYKENNKLLFPTAEEQKQFKDILSSNNKLFELLTGKYIELSKLINEEDTEKNSGKPGNGKSTDSK